MMIKTVHWHKLPSTPVLKALPHMTWQRIGNKSAATGTAALMLYVTLCFRAEQAADNDSEAGYFAKATYDDLGEATDLSRPLIAQGLNFLTDLGLITPKGSHQKRQYGINWGTGGWFKLPCQAIVKSGVILPFKSFTLRSRYELHAMKLYLYLAAVRNNTSVYSAVSYEKIFDRIGISERDIRKAIIVLTSCNLLANVEREITLNEEGERFYGPNKYFLTGYKNLSAPARVSSEAIA